MPSETARARSASLPAPSARSACVGRYGATAGSTGRAPARRAPGVALGVQMIEPAAGQSLLTSTLHAVQGARVAERVPSEKGDDPIAFDEVDHREHVRVARLHKVVHVREVEKAFAEGQHRGGEGRIALIRAPRPRRLRTSRARAAGCVRPRARWSVGPLRGGTRPRWS